MLNDVERELSMMLTDLFWSSRASPSANKVAGRRRTVCRPSDPAMSHHHGTDVATTMVTPATTWASQRVFEAAVRSGQNGEIARSRVRTGCVIGRESVNIPHPCVVERTALA